MCLFEAATFEAGLGESLTVPAEEVTDEFLLLFEVFGLDLAPVIEGDVFDFLDAFREFGASATEDPEGVDFVGFGSAEGEGDTEGVLADAFHTLEPAADEVGGHEDLGEFGVVLVLGVPHGPAFLVEFLEEPGEGSTAGVLVVGVFTLPGVEDELGRGKIVEGVLLLGGFNDGFFVVLSFGSRGGFLLLRSSFLLGGFLLGSFGLGDGEAVSSSHLLTFSETRVGVEDGHVVTDDVLELPEFVRLGEQGEGEFDGGGEDDISTREAFTDEEGAGFEPSFKTRKAALEGGELFVLDVFREVSPTHNGAEDGGHRSVDFVGGEVNPHVNLRGFSGVLTVEGLAVLFSEAEEVAADGVRFEDVTVSTSVHDGGTLARVAVLQPGLSFVVNTPFDVFDGDVEVGDLDDGGELAGSAAGTVKDTLSHFFKKELLFLVCCY